MKKVLGILGLSLVLILLVIWFGGRWILSFSTAQYSGEVFSSGVTQPVEVTFDGKGIPQLWAQNEPDLFFALGYIHASERLFQMELIRRLSAGRLAGILGEPLLEMDRRQRTIGFRRLAERDLPTLEDSTLGLLDNYCAGINSWISGKNILPPEFVILNFRPEAWKPVDCLAIGIYQTWFAHALMDNDQKYQKLVKKYGELVEKYLMAPFDWSPHTVHDSFLESLLFQDNFPLRMTRASNSWVVGPNKSASGAALHASDPHLPINMVPTFWYIAGLHSETGLNVLGVTTPGLPFVLMGHNAKIGFAFTVASIDIIDYYRERRNPVDSLQVLTPNGYQKLTVLKEEIQVKGREEPVTETIYLSPNGVVVDSDSVSVLSLKWAGFDFNSAELFRAGLELQKAENFQQFRRSVTRLGALDVNWTYSDVNGNIGYQLGAPIPRRSFNNTFLQLTGADLQQRWQGYYPLETTPHVLNPVEGWIASCNNQIVSDKWPYALPGFYDPYRITRAKAHLSQNHKFQIKDFEKMQMDQKSAIALRWKKLLAEGLYQEKQTDLAQKIDAWDGIMKTELFEPALFTFWWDELTRVLFEDDLGAEWKLGHELKEAALSEQLPQIIDNHLTADKLEVLADISAAAARSALAKLENRNYGEVCQLTAVHPLSKVKILDYWLNLNRGPLPNGGDNGALNANWRIYDSKTNQYQSVVGPSMRFLLDWADVDGFTILNSLGQSGNPFSPHYDDFLEMWQTGERWQVPFSREKVFANRKSLLKIIPGSGE